MSPRVTGDSGAVDMPVVGRHATSMSKMIQVKNVPDDVHCTLKARAAQARMTLSDYVLRALSDLAARPDLDEVLARLEARGRRGKRFDSAASVRAERDARR